MQEVRDILDTKLKNNDKHLIDNILSFISPETNVCFQCKCCDVVEYIKDKGYYMCIYCINKSVLAVSFNTICEIHKLHNKWLSLLDIAKSTTMSVKYK